MSFILLQPAISAQPAPAQETLFFGLNAGYPGIVPGPMEIKSQGQTISASNNTLSVSWAWDQHGLRPTLLCDAQAGHSLRLTGDVFQIIMANGEQYSASTLLPGKPRVSKLKANAKAARLAARIPGQMVELPLRSADGLLSITWRMLATDGANYVRQELEVTARQDCVPQEFRWLNQTIPDAQSAGRVDGVPLQAGNFFFAVEDPHSTILQTNEHIACRLPRHAPLRQGEKLTQSFVMGVAPEGQMRRAFLYYLERERAHPYRPYLHYNSWYDIAWHPFALNETNCLNAIRVMGDRFLKAHDMIVDGMVFDDGWDNPKSLWKFHAGFPNGFAPHAKLCRQYNTRLGVWLSPFGGYGEPKAQRLKFGHAQGYETNTTGFSMSGPKYYAAFKNACVGMIRKYDVNHFKFDGIAAGVSAAGGAQYILDTEAIRRLMLELREENPNLYINFTTGSWPSPFWLRYADSLWRQGGDMGHAGIGTKQQQWLTYRDQETCRNIVRRSPLYPINSLMTQGVAYSRHGSAGDPSFNSAGFKDDVRAFFASGTGLQELYIQPDKLTPEDWRVLAEAAKWSRANADVLVDTHWLGGDPGKLEVYGWAAWCPHKAVLALRNPNDRLQDIVIDLEKAFELPSGARRNYTLRSPWAEDAQKPSLAATVGQVLRFELKPFEVLVFDALPTP